MNKEQRQLLVLSSLGGVLEFYDFIIFALFAGYIAKAFFPATDHLAGLLITFATFAIGYLVRPLGGIVFGHFGDRIGRKTTFTISILMMAIATLGIGSIPSYAMIGFSAPVLVISLRILQGISIGGEIPGAITYVSESFHDQKGLACGIIFCALTLGIVLGSVVHALIVSFLAEDAMQSYGWRIPFLFGGLLGLLSYVLRRELHESTPFKAIAQSVEKLPILTVVKRHLAVTIAGSLFTAVCAVIVTSLFLFTPVYFTNVLHLPANAYVWQRTGAIALGSVLSIFFGYLTDFVSMKKLVVLLALSTGLFSYPIYAIYANYSTHYLVAFIASAILLGFSAGIVPRLLSELFPTSIRYSGIALSYNVGFAVFGGLTPFISLSLVYYTGWNTIPAAYLSLVAIASIGSLLLLRRNQHSFAAIGHLNVSARY